MKNPLYMSKSDFLGWKWKTFAQKNVGTKLIWKKFHDELMARWEHGKMHNQITLQHKWKINHQVGIDI